ncbi:MAG: LysM peptidoglycan-binding domain-containing protein [Chloroflexi bacterium]|nr:LysM peptidoglycan-binding domain-containing protein [Chloroflexota bacterium]
MGSVKRSTWRIYLPYLALNAAISIAAVLVVLFFWSRRPTPPQLIPTPTKNIATEIAILLPTATATLPPSPTPNVYVVQVGDTLLAIAIELELSMNALMAANGLANPDDLSVGQTLIVPSAEWIEVYEERRASAALTPTATATPEVEPSNVQIMGIAGAGDLEREAIRFLNSGGIAIMQDWRLDDGEGHTYIFPAFTLHAGAFNLNIAVGEDTPIDLYWGLDQAILTPGTELTLLDSSGRIQSTFRITGE